MSSPDEQFDDAYVRDHAYHGEHRAGASCDFRYVPGLGTHGTRCGVPQNRHADQGEELVKGHRYQDGPGGACSHTTAVRRGSASDPWTEDVPCLLPRRLHADPGPYSDKGSLLATHPHDFTPQEDTPTLCGYVIQVPGSTDKTVLYATCGYPEELHHWADYDRRLKARGSVGAVVRKADAAQYERAPMPDAARRGPVVTLIDAPVDPLGTLAVIGGIYTGQVARSKAEVTDEQRRAMLADMQKTVLDGPLEAIQFTFLVEGVSRAFTHQAVRNRFSFFAQESLRFAVAEDWAQEVPLPPSLAQGTADSPAVGLWRKALNAAEDAYAALVGAGMPAEEARGVLPHAITTRYYWTVSLRTLLQEAGKRTCTQAQFDWRIVMGGVAKALREHARNLPFYEVPILNYPDRLVNVSDGWQYRAFADLIRPVCYQQGRCGFMAKFDRGCTIRSRVDANERLGRPSSEWGTEYDVVDPLEVVVGVGPRSVVVDAQERPVFIGAIDPAEWAADPAAARVTERERPATDAEVKEWLG